MGRALVMHKAKGSALQRAEKASMEVGQAPQTQAEEGAPCLETASNGVPRQYRDKTGTRSAACTCVESAHQNSSKRIEAASAYSSSGCLLETREQTNPAIQVLRAGRRTFGESRDLAAGISRLYLTAAAAFGCTMLCLGVLSVLQTEAQWYPSASFIRLRSLAHHPDTQSAATQISHAISLLDLHHRTSSPAAGNAPRQWPWRRAGAGHGGDGDDERRQASDGTSRELPRSGAHLGGKGFQDDNGRRGPTHAMLEPRDLQEGSVIEGQGWRDKSEYAICQAHFWGLTPVDYSILSLAAYFKPSELPRIMPVLFPTEYGFVPPTVVPYDPQPAGASTASNDEPRSRSRKQADHGAESEGERAGSDAGGIRENSIFWTEFRFDDKNLTVVALRGTEFWRVSDWLEDVRMWTGLERVQER